MTRILLSNDDGIYAKGLSILSQHLCDLGALSVFAPDRNRSGASNSLTLSSPLRIKEVEQGISVEGTPTDCVHLAITGLLNELPDMVVTGINAGANLGDDVWYSGTVAAAMEGRFLGFPAMAVSLCGEQHQHFETAGRVARFLTEYILANPLPHKIIFNVNVPDIPYSQIRSYKITRLGTRHRAECTVSQVDPRGHPIYWVGPAGSELDAGKGTDFHAIANNCVSITPLRIDMTHYEVLGSLEEWMKGCVPCRST